MSAHMIALNTRDVTPEVFDDAGQFRVMHSDYWRTTTSAERGLLAMNHAMYVLPTIELIDRLHDLIAGRAAIEIGSGSGLLAGALGIPATDNHMQERSDIRAIYAAIGQSTIAYGTTVERLDAHAAVCKHKPQVVVAAWVTHVYDPLRPQAGGNVLGVNENEIIDSVESYIFVGNQQVHAGKKIWARPYTIEHPGYVFSRAMNGTPDFIAVWNRTV